MKYCDIAVTSQRLERREPSGPCRDSCLSKQTDFCGFKDSLSEPFYQGQQVTSRCLVIVTGGGVTVVTGGRGLSSDHLSLNDKTVVPMY